MGFMSRKTVYICSLAVAIAIGITMIAYNGISRNERISSDGKSVSGLRIAGTADGGTFVPKEIQEIPYGFVQLGYTLRNGLRSLPWESNIVFLDSDDINIYQTGLENSDFIVSYKDEYYVNEEKLLELEKIAAIAPEQRKKTYGLEDVVEIKGIDETVYTVQITSIEAIATEADAFDNYTTYNIKCSVSSNTGAPEPISNLLQELETEGGVKYDFKFLDDTTAQTVIRERGGSDKIKSFTFKHPKYSALTYKIMVN
jgi:hypothetical protein